MRPKAILCLLVLVLGAYPVHVLGARPAISLAARLDILNRICIDRVDVLPPVLEKPFKIPVGCEVIDCCPGCPGGGVMEWRIQVEAKVLEGAELRFEGLSAEDLKQLRITGNAKLEGNRILVRRGMSTVGGLPALTAGTVPIGSLTPLIDKAAAARLPSTQSIIRPSPGDPDAGGVGDNITVQQFLGPFRVNSFRWRPIFYPCIRPGVTAGDQLRVRAIAGGDNVVVMMDSRTAAGGPGCTDDEVLRSTGASTFANILAASGCNAEIAVFATNNAMNFDTPVKTWTDSTSDIHTSSLQPIINMPVSVWIANNAAAVQAVNDVANANLLYGQNKIGVQFTATYNNVSGNPNAVATIGNASCGAVAAIQGSAFYTANALNIYYVNGAFTGENCARTVPVGDGNVSYLGTLANLASLAHEIGHAFGLRPAGQGGHTNGLAGFGNNNIMWGGGPATRDAFTLGQAFRMNTHTDGWGGTMLINDGLRPGPGRACPPLTTSSICPALALDWARP